MAKPALSEDSTLGDRIAVARTMSTASQQEVADLFGISTQAVSQWEHDKTVPNTERIAMLAHFFSVRVEWLMFGRGEMTIDDEDARPLELKEKVSIVPLIELVDVDDWPKSVTEYSRHSQEYIDGETNYHFLLSDLFWLGGSSFALEVTDSSMEPEIRIGDKIIADPAVSPRPGDYVVAKIEDEVEAAVIRKYRLPQKTKLGEQVIVLSPINEDWPSITIGPERPGRIVGTVVEHRRYRQM